MNYTIEREKRVKGREGEGRIDLFIEDTENKFLIIIENKLHSNIIDKTEDDGISKTQLDNYTNYANERRYSSFDKAYILLSKKKIEKEYPPFKKVDYRYLYDEILCTRERVIKDDIFKDYKLLLQSLYLSTDRIKLKKELFEITHKDFKTINLSDIEEIKKALK